MQALGSLAEPQNTPGRSRLKSLSARGSTNFPKLDTRLYFRARYPSKVSVRLAIINMETAIYLGITESGLSAIKNTKKGLKESEALLFYLVNSYYLSISAQSYSSSPSEISPIKSYPSAPIYLYCDKIS